MENFIIINTKFGDKKNYHYYFKDEDCLFSVNKEKNGYKYLNCIAEDCQCKSRIFENFMTRTNPNVCHNHQNHKYVAEYEMSYNQLKIEVDTNMAPIRQLHKVALRQLSREAAGLLAWQNVRGTLYRIRSLKMPSCHNIEDLNFLLNNNEYVYKTYGTIRGKDFYNGTVKGQFFFSNPDLISSIEENFEFFIDGTHGVVPYRQEQLLVILATLKGKPRPIIYVIMSNKTEENYTTVFNFIKNCIFPKNRCFFSPSGITMDFEMALRNAAKKVWSNAPVFGCNFHYCQALNRKATSYDYLSERIENSSKHKEFLLMTMRLSLLPYDMICDGIKALEKFMLNDAELKQNFGAFWSYFNGTWIKRYPPSEWCVSSRRFRTNNHLEGYNLKIKQWIPLNPTPWCFLDALIDLAFDADAEYENARVKNITYKDNSRLSPHLQLLIPQLKEGVLDELEFLSKMAFV